MKLRFRANSLRLRLNQKEVEALAFGGTLTERVDFPGSTLTYLLKSGSCPAPEAIFADGNIQIAAPAHLVTTWARSEDIGLYFTLPTTAEPLQISIEKDLECIDGPEEDKDPNAFPRAVGSLC